MLLAFRYVRQGIISVDLSPILEWAAVVEVRRFDRTLGILEIGIAPPTVSAIKIPMRIRSKQRFMSAIHDFREGRSITINACTPYLDDCVLGKCQVVVEEVFFPDDWNT